MSIRTLLETSLSVPVKRPDYKGNAVQYVTYQMIGQTGTIYAESTEAETGTEFLLNIWSKIDYTQLLADLKRILLQAHYRVSVMGEYFEKDSGYYRVIVETACIGANYG